MCKKNGQSWHHSNGSKKPWDGVDSDVWKKLVCILQFKRLKNSLCWNSNAVFVDSEDFERRYHEKILDQISQDFFAISWV